MHQPPGNLRALIDTNEWEAQQIMRCYERVPRYAKRFGDVARLHVGFSGILLEQLLAPEIIDRYRAFVDIPAMLNAYREADNIEIIGMGYYHPIFPLIPRDDWADQLEMGRQLTGEVFGREPRGFWPPEMAFDMEMIPALAASGYAYVVVDGVHVRSDEDATTPLDPYDTYRANTGGAGIVVVPRDRDLSNAQESGLDAGWFADQVSRKLSARDARGAVSLVTTWSDGENGGWFRQMHEESGFFGHFFAPCMERVRSGDCPVRPILISEFMERAGARDDAFVRTGAWNVAQTSGYDFSQWAGSEAQRQALEAVVEVSRRYWRVDASRVSGDERTALDEARRLILESETSCYLFWGDDWIPQLYTLTARANELLDRVAPAVDKREKP